VKGKNMDWNKKGHIISGFYEGVAYAGKVASSYKESGGQVRHSIDLFESIYIDDKKFDNIVVNDLLTAPLINNRLSA